MESSSTGSPMELRSSGDGTFWSRHVNSCNGLCSRGACVPLLLGSFFCPRGNSIVPGTAEPQVEHPGHLGLCKGNLLRADCTGRSSCGLSVLQLIDVIIPALMHRFHQNFEVKCAWVGVVPGWVTSWEVLVLFCLFPLSAFGFSGRLQFTLGAGQPLGVSCAQVQGIPSVKRAILGCGKSLSHTLLLNSRHRTWNG